MFQENIYSNIEETEQEDNAHSQPLLSSSSAESVDNSMLIPDKTDGSTNRPISGESHVNSVYENYEIPLRRSESQAEKIKASKSVIMQFDPLTGKSTFFFVSNNIVTLF